MNTMRVVAGCRSFLDTPSRRRLREPEKSR